MKLSEKKNAVVVNAPGTWKKPTLWQQIKKNKTSYFMMAPFLVLFFIFTVIPVISSLLLSFTYFNMLEWPSWRGLANYQQLLLEDDVFVIAVKNTLIFAFITGPISYVLCFVFAWFINELPNKVRPIMTFIFYLPSLSGAAFFVIWATIFSSDSYGYVNAFLMQWGLIDGPIKWLTDPAYNFKVIVIIELWLSLGTSFLSFVAGFRNVSSELYEAGAIDGIRNRFQELFSITIPSMKPQMMFGAVMQIAASFAIGNVGAILSGFPSTNYSVHTVTMHIRDYGNVRYEMGYAAAISFMLTVVMILTRNVITKLLNPDE
ncbi:MAG: sugar ABC transporter permease [Clostridia bacterium]|nr:sugar ABC transporter permease [Clostridia bacterium]